MLDDLLELTGSLVHQEEHHSPARARSPPPIASHSHDIAMAPRSRHSKSASVASASSTGGSTAVASTSNGEMLPPTNASSPSSPTTATRKPRTSSRSSNVNASPTPVVVIPSKKSTANESAPTTQPYDVTAEAAKFAVTVVLSTLLEAALQTVAGSVGIGDLAAVSKRPESWLEISALLGWKVVLLGVYWFCGFDG